MNNQGLYTAAEVAATIEKGDTLLLAGDHHLLETLPKGKWIGGCTSQFIENGKITTTREKIFVHNITDIAQDVRLSVYDTTTIQGIYDDAYENGFSVLMIPFHADIKTEYALNCVNYSKFGTRPVCGWLSVTPFYTNDQNDVSIVFFGESGLSYDNAGVAMHIGLSSEKYVEIQSFNPYVPDHDGDEILFEENGTQAEDVLINGVKQNFKQYMIDKNIDRTPKTNNVLVGTYFGILVNTVIFPELEFSDNTNVTLGNPVFKDVPYKFAKLNSAESYANMEQIDDEIVFSFSCATNFVFPDDFVKYLTHTNGPFVYGEFSYFLLNNTTVYVTVGNLEK